MDRINLFFNLHEKLVASGFVFERQQRPHSQNRGDIELKFTHPSLESQFSNRQLRNKATKFYIKPLSDEEEVEIGLTTGKTSPLFTLDEFPSPNAIDTHNGNNQLNAWVNRSNDNSLDELLSAIRRFTASTLESSESDFNEQVHKSMSFSSEERLQRLQDAPKMPSRKIVTALNYKRNPDVVAEVLFRANGKCEACGADAPFLRKSDNTPYLEVHHIKQLAKGGEDTVENAIALCPNCHREQHFG